MIETHSAEHTNGEKGENNKFKLSTFHFFNPYHTFSLLLPNDFSDAIQDRNFSFT